jgi:hypothetical protein
MRRLASIERRMDAVAIRIQPQQRWGRVIIDDPDPEARIAEHQRATAGARCVYRIIVDPDPATHAAGEAILTPCPKPKSTGQGSGIFERHMPKPHRPRRPDDRERPLA